MAMKFLTAEIKKRLPGLHATEKIATDEKIAQVKFFSIQTRGTWFAVEYDPNEKLFFGYVISPLGSDCDEWGYFSEEELQSVKCFGSIPGIERDLYFKPKKMGEIIKEYSNR